MPSSAELAKPHCRTRATGASSNLDDAPQEEVLLKAVENITERHDILGETLTIAREEATVGGAAPGPLILWEEKDGEEDATRFRCWLARAL